MNNNNNAFIYHHRRKPDVPEKAVMARGDHLRLHFKKTREVAHAIKGMPLIKAQIYLKNVLEHKAAIPIKRFTGGGGSHAQGKLYGVSASHVAWPTKPTTYILSLLRNAQANAEVKQLDIKKLLIQHISVNRAIKMRRRTFRAHGRVGAYMRSPCHIELFCAEKKEKVPKEKKAAPIVSRRALAMLRMKKVKVGGGLKKKEEETEKKA